MTTPEVQRPEVPRVADERTMLEAWLDYRRGVGGQHGPEVAPIYYSDERPEGDIEDLDDPPPAAVFAAYRQEVERCRAATAGVPLDQLAGAERVTGIEPASRAWKARPAPVVWPDVKSMGLVSASWDEPLLTVRDRLMPVLRARGGRGRRGSSALRRCGDGHKLNWRVRPVHDAHLSRWQAAYRASSLWAPPSRVIGC